MPIPVDVIGGPAQLTWWIGQDENLYAHELQTDCLFTIYEDIEKFSIQGPPGPVGPAGPQGLAGPQGAPSTVPGPAGPEGPVGDTGASGPQGTPGATGATGPQGPQGTTGPPGPTGNTGPTGPQGIQGPTGPTGPKGNDGTSVVLKGSVTTFSALPSTGNTFGDLWVTTDTGHGWVWSQPGQWADVGPIQGPAGPQGPQGTPGAQGPAGATGTQGPPGNTGTQGLAGPTGPTGPIGPAGPTGPKGDTGATGPQGLVGATGPQGPAGSTVPADATQNGLLRKVSGNTTDFVDGTNNCQPIAPQIWSARLRSFNAVGNCNFECDQRTVSSVITANGFMCDRWQYYNTSASTGSCQKITTTGFGAGLNLPGTSFAITNSCVRFTVTTQKASLATTDICEIYQVLEGPMWRELSNDVHSISLLVRSSVANVQFGLFISDNSSRTLAKLCTTGAANTLTLITLANLPTWPSGGTWSSAPGSQGYFLGISLACGSGKLVSANDVFQNINANGAVGQGNFLGQVVGSTFDIAFVQHEPGPVCTTLIDKPFNQNLDECLRYFTKSYDYSTKPGTASVTNGVIPVVLALASTSLNPAVQFKKPLAKVPASIVIYNQLSGASSSMQFNGAAATVSSVGWYGDAGFGLLTMAASQSAGSGLFHYTADTGW